MQNNFSKCREWVPRGTSQHKWRWLTTLLLILTLGIGQMWAVDVTLFTANFNDAVWASHATICSGTTSEETIEGILFRCNDNSKSYSVADGALTFCNNNIGDKYYFLIHLEDVNGSVHVSFGTVSNSQRISYKWFEQTARPTSSSSATATAGSINTNKEIALDYSMTGSGSDLWLMVGRQGSGQGTVIKTITITTPAAADVAPVITAPTTDQSASYTVGDAITALSVTATGTPTPTYQWYSNASASTTGATLITGAESASYTPSNAEASDLYYYCVATNSKGSAQSPYFHVTVSAAVATAPSFTSPASEPAVAEYSVGDAISALEVVAAGYPTPTLQWYSNSSKSTEGATLITGAESASYTPSNAAVSDLYFYCVATNASGTAQSEYFHVTVAAVSYCAELYPATSGASPTGKNQELLLQSEAPNASYGGKIYTAGAKDNNWSASFIYTANGLQLNKGGADSARVELTHLMQVGTVITATLVNPDASKARGYKLLNMSKTVKATWQATTTDPQTYTYTVVAGDGLAGTNMFLLNRAESSALKELKVSNCGAELHALTSAIDPVAADGKATITLSKSLVAEGATATATYSDIDAAYDFDEWVISGATIDDEKANPVTITMGSTDAVVTLKLKAASVKHTVTYYDGEAILANKLGEELIEHNDHPTGAGLTPKKQGYTFGGWSLTNGGGAIASYASVTVDENKDLFAVWTPVVCPTSGTVFAFEMNESAKPGSEVKAPQKDVLVIDEYLTITGQGSAIIGNTTNNTNQYASVKTDPKISLSGATGYLQIALECALQAGDVITIAKNNTQIYISDEVGTSGPTGNKYTTATNAENTIVVGANETTAAWVGAMNLYFWYKGGSVSITAVSVTRPAKHTLAWNFDGGNTTSTTHTAAGQVVEGAAITYPADNTMSKDGYTFSGWSTDVTEMPTSDLTITALWAAWPTMTLNRGAATSGDDVVTSVEPGSAVTVPACPFSYTDYNFNGWEYSPVVTVENGEFTMPSENLTLTAQWVDANNVAQIGSTKYLTLEAALEHAADGEIVLLQDINVEAQVEIADGVSATIDLAGHKIEYTSATTLPSGVILVHNGGSLTINDSSDPDAGSVVAGEKAYAALMLTKAGDDASKVANLTINGGSFTGYYYAISGNGNRPNTNITINGGTFTATAANDNLAIYHPQNGTLTINGGSFEGYLSAIEMRAGSLVINDGSFTATAPTFSCNAAGSGTTTQGAAIAIAQHTTKKDIEVTINGGTFTGVKALNESNPQANDPAPQVTMAVTAGTFTGEVSTVDVDKFVSGGSFSEPVAEANCADDYYPATKPNGKYGVTYAAEPIDFEAFIDENGTGDDAKTLLASQLAAKHYELSEALNTDHLDAPAGKPQDKGLKVKKTGLEIYFSVEPEKVLEIKTGNISGASLSINGGAAEDLTSTSIATHTYYNDNAQAVVLRMTKADNKYNIFQSINIRNPYQVTLDATTNGGEAVAPMYGKMSVILPSATKGTDHFIGWYDRAEEEGRVLVGLADAEYTPTADVTLYAHFAAQSNDGRLSDLQVDGTTVDGFDMDVHIYNLTVPYGTAVSALPKITLATAYDSYAQGVSIYPTDGPEWRADVDGGCYVQQANVTAENGSVVYNQVRTKILPKDMACLVWADVPSANTLTYNASKSLLPEDAVTLAINNVNGTDGPAGVKFQKKGYIKIEMNEGTFQVGDVVALDVTGAAGSTMHVFKVQTPSSEADVIGTGEGSTTPVGVNKVAITEDAVALYLARPNDGTYNGWNPHVDYVAVYRAYPKPLVETITFNGAAAVVDNDLKTITVEVPASTDMDAVPVVASFLSNDPSQTNGAVTGGTWAEGDNEYIVTDKDNDQTVYTVTITKAVPSNDATLETLTYGTPATAITLADGVFEYNVELPYGTSAVPALAATVHHAGASITETNNAAAFVNRQATSTITITAEDGTTTQTYTVNFTITAWNEVVIWDGSTMDALKTSPDATTGLAWATNGFGSISSYNTTYGEKAYTKYLPSGGTAPGRYMTLTVPAGYVAKFYVVMASHSDGSERGMFIGSNLVKDPDATSVLQLSNNDRDEAVAGMSEIVGAGTYYINPNASVDFQEIRAYVRPGYARTAMLGDGVLGTVCVDHNVAIEDIQGVTVYELMGREPEFGKLAFDEIVSGELEAGAPYVFQAHGDKMIMFYGETSVSEPVDKGNGMYGTFVDQTLTELNDIYYFAQRALWSCVDLTELSLPANRAYVKLSEIDYLSDPNPAPGRRRITMTVNGEKVATDIENLNASETPVKLIINGQMYILRGEKLFDATGRLVK